MSINMYTSHHDQSNAIRHLCFSIPQGIFVKDKGSLVKTGIFNDLSNFAQFIDLAIIIWLKETVSCIKITFCPFITHNNEALFISSVSFSLCSSILMDSNNYLFFICVQYYIGHSTA